MLAISGCAQYQVQSTKANGYSRPIDRLTVWSAVPNVPKLTEKHWSQSDSFDNLFHDALKQELLAAGATTEVRAFSPASDSMESLARFERELSPSMRLLIAPTRVSTVTSQGHTGITQVVFNLSLYETEKNQRVWRGQIIVDTPLGGARQWGEDGAKSLATQIVEALKKDRLLEAGPVPNQKARL
jgi:hypothetical protein